MAYYQILKQRRLDLNLSVQDVAIQTHLKPEYIRAIEDNNLDVFSDDFSYVRYFFHAYCDAIGVNWKAVVQEVDATVAAYAAARDQALSQAQSRMIRSVPSKQTKASARKSVRRRKKSFLQHSAGKLSRILNWDSRNRLAKTVMIGTVCLVCGLVALDLISDQLSAKAREEAKITREQELKEKEERTQQMAQERKEQLGQEVEPEENSLPVIVRSSENENRFTVSYDTRTSQTVRIDFETFIPTEILLYLDDTPVYNQEIDGIGTCETRIPYGSTLTIYLKNPVPRDTVSIDGTPVDADMNLLASNPDAGIVLEFSKKQAESEKGADGQNPENSDGTNEAPDNSD